MKTTGTSQIPGLARATLAMFAVLGWLLGTGAVRAEQIRFGIFSSDTAEPDVIRMKGPIDAGAALDFRRILLRTPSARLLVLDSGGGVVAMALLIADDVHQRGLATVVPEGAVCLSACAYIYFAGGERVVDGSLGVHQISSGEPDVESAQVAISDIIDVLNRFGTPIEVLTVMFRTPADDMHVFSRREIEDYGIERRSVPDGAGRERVADSPSDRGTGAPEVDEAGPVRISPPAAEARSPDLSVIEDFARRPNRIAVYAGLDFFGGDLGAERVDEISACAARCLGLEGCRAFTFNADDRLRRGANCFLKDGTGEPDGNAVAISGVFLSRAQPNPDPIMVGVIDPALGLLKDVDIPYGDLSSRPAAAVTTPGACRRACVRNDRCVAFTFVKNLGQCWLKGSAAGWREAEGMVSGTKKPMTFVPVKIIDLDG